MPASFASFPIDERATVPTFASRSHRISAALVAVTLGLATALVAAPAANAATLNVTSTLDDGSAGTLRAAILAANASAGADTINVTATGTITLTASPITITEAVTITGPGLGNLTITRDAAFDMFSIDMAAADQDVAISGINFVGAGDDARGVVALANVPARNFSVTNSQFSGFNVLDPTYGGGIFIGGLSGNFSSANTDYLDNLGTYVGTGIYVRDVVGTVSVSDSLFDNNAADGGAAFSANTSGPVSISNSVFTDNVTNNGGGAIFLDANDSVTISGSTFEDNTAQTNDGGAGYIRDTVGAVLIQGSTFTSNSSGSSGGALVVFGPGTGSPTLNITGSTFTSNTAVDGGAIYASQTGTTAISASTFALNSASEGGALLFADLIDILTVSDNSFDSNTSATNGGAILFDDVDETSGLIENTFVGNEAQGGFGGAVYANVVSDQLLIFADTFTENFANSVGTSIGIGSITGGVAIANSTLLEEDATSVAAIVVTGGVQSSGLLFFVSSTLLANGAIGAAFNDGQILVSNSIINGDVTNQNLDPFEIGAGDPISVEWSILTTAFDATTMVDGSGNQYSTNPQLGALADNGGPTQTMLPLAGSPAINLGDPAYSFVLTTDQRGAGFTRIAQGRIDIGAVETQLVTLALAATGLDISPILPVGGALVLLAGCALFVVARRRRTTEELLGQTVV
jgi:predicted outer membrane repeat protein